MVSPDSPSDDPPEPIPSLAGLILLHVGIGIDFRRRVISCESCGARWRWPGWMLDGDRITQGPLNLWWVCPHGCNFGSTWAASASAYEPFGPPPDKLVDQALGQPDRPVVASAAESEQNRRGRFPTRVVFLRDVGQAVEALREAGQYPSRAKVARWMEAKAQVEAGYETASEKVIGDAHRAFGLATWNAVLAELGGSS